MNDFVHPTKIAAILLNNGIGDLDDKAKTVRAVYRYCADFAKAGRAIRHETKNGLYKFNWDQAIKEKTKKISKNDLTYHTECQHTSYRKFATNQKGKKPRYFCRQCGRTFTQPSTKGTLRIPLKRIIAICQLIAWKVPLSKIESQTRTNRKTILLVERTFLNKGMTAQDFLLKLTKEEIIR